MRTLLEATADQGGGGYGGVVMTLSIDKLTEYLELAGEDYTHEQRVELLDRIYKEDGENALNFYMGIEDIGAY